MNGNSLNTSDIACLIICSVRYAMGRMTYVPHEVSDIVKKTLPELRDDTLVILDRDIRRELDRGNYGMDCDLQMWQNLLKRIKQEMQDRGKL